MKRNTTWFLMCLLLAANASCGATPISPAAARAHLRSIIDRTLAARGYRAITTVRTSPPKDNPPVRTTIYHLRSEAMKILSEKGAVETIAIGDRSYDADPGKHGYFVTVDEPTRHVALYEDFAYMYLRGLRRATRVKQHGTDFFVTFSKREVRGGPGPSLSPKHYVSGRARIETRSGRVSQMTIEQTDTVAGRKPDHFDWLFALTYDRLPEISAPPSDRTIHESPSPTCPPDGQGPQPGEGCVVKMPLPPL